ncbi:Transposon Ty3-G Gag-Pol polyprotein [Gossypium australe]|uniref:Transposon Ty3-G Gag-Pol polyprotein n=1 Tax=Gossypium australe TaxID=47621 RepID=A0A5B6VAB8_9ROSI|nr:Transposon Ty3-G Gag-Pol polyprotein [Gossypium australe]
MVVSVVIVGFEVKRILVDSGSTVEVLTWEAYQKMRLKEKTLKRASPLYDFTNHPIEVKGCITFPVTLRDDRVVKILSTLASEEEDNLMQCLRANTDAFAWSVVDMPGVDHRVIVHRFNVLPEAKPVKQKRRRFAPQVLKVMRQEVGKLLSTRFIREVEYPD